MVCSVAAAWLRFSPSIDPLSDPFFSTCGCVFNWDWVGIVSPVEGEASSSSQFQSSISESRYSGTFTLGSSRLESQLVAASSFTLVSGSTNSLGGWSAMGVGLLKAVVWERVILGMGGDGN